MQRLALVLGLVGVASVAALTLFGQSSPASPRLVNVDGRNMRVWRDGAARTPSRPLVILEAGGGATLDTWRPVFSDIAQLAPTLAYDRRGLGESAFDDVPATFHHRARSLRALLDAMREPPPYLLVGHSLGGIIIRAFADLHPNDVAGLVYIDVPDFEATAERRAAVFPPEERARALAPPEVPPIPPGTPPGGRAEMQHIIDNVLNFFAEARALKPPPAVPAAVLIAAPPSRAAGLSGALLRLQIRHQSEWALAAPKGLLIVADHVGHVIHNNDPALVVRAVKHVLDNQPAGR